MTLDDAILQRRSVRGFLAQEVPDATIREVLELARWAPSNRNVQPWLPHVMSGSSLTPLREALVAAAQAQQPFDPDWPADGKYHGVYRERQYDAAAHGIGSCGQGALGLHTGTVRRHLGLAADHRLLFGISFGYEDPALRANAARTVRAPLAEAVRFHR